MHRVGVAGAHPERFRGGLVFKAHRRLYHSTLGLRAIKKGGRTGSEWVEPGIHASMLWRRTVSTFVDPFRVQGAGFRVQGSGFGVQGSGSVSTFVDPCGVWLSFTFIHTHTHTRIFM